MLLIWETNRFLLLNHIILGLRRLNLVYRAVGRVSRDLELKLHSPGYIKKARLDVA